MTGKLPKNWRNFLRHSANKAELFDYLAEKVVEHHSNNRVIVTPSDAQMPSATTPSIALVRSHPAVTKKPTQVSSYMSKMQ